MTTDPWQLLEDASTILAVHAHPDDESLSTGALLTWLAVAGKDVVLVTATRGEEGEIVDGAIGADETRSLDQVRAEEIDQATAALGITQRHLLGTAPALAPGAEPRIYRDSGMQWVREGLAGPSPTAGTDSFSLRPLEDATADLLALIDTVHPDLLLGYDDEGTYGHPDHVRAHHLAAAAADRSRLPLLEVASKGAGREGFHWRDLPQTRPTVLAALRSYRTQLTVLGADETGIAIRHVGGQDDLITSETGLRLRQTHQAQRETSSSVGK